MNLFRQPAATGPAHEPDRTNARALTAWTIGLVGLIVLTIVVVTWLLGFLSAAKRPQSRPPRTGPAAAEHWRNPPTDLERLRRQETQNLNTYGWIDRDAGVVRIPVERAMELMAANGGDRPTTQPSK